MTLLACFSSFVFVNLELGPEMHMDPSSRQLRPNTGAATLDTAASRSPIEMWKPHSRMADAISLHCPLTPENRAKPMVVPHPFQGEATSSSASTSAA